MSRSHRSAETSPPPSRVPHAGVPGRPCSLLLASLAIAALVTLPGAASGQERGTAPEGAVTTAVGAEGAPPAQRGAPRGEGCSAGSLTVLNDLVGSLTEDSFQPNPSIGGGGGTDPPGCGKPNRTRREDAGNPVGMTRAASFITFTGDFP